MSYGDFCLKHVNLYNLFLIASTAILLFTFSEGLAKSFEDKIIAIVNNEIITESELEGSNLFPDKSVSSLIEKKLQLQTAQKKGLIASESEILSAIEDIKRVNSFRNDKEFEDALLRDGSSIEKYKKDLRDQLIILKLVNKEVKSKITINNKEIEDYYIANKTKFLLPEEIKIAYIQIPFKSSDSPEAVQTLEKRIKDMLKDSKNNNKSFSEIIRSFKGIPEVNVNENSGYVKKGHLLKELDKAAFDMNKDEVSDVITTGSGFYILKVLDRKTIDYRSLNDIREDVNNMLIQEKTEKTYKEWLLNIKTSSYIEIM
ncbi:MAG: peptidyl-prolyl cis-trans isomerase [Nitrospirae bacterium]|nr:peptidyl-prolyl cis-trans isomerase [Nitrospirota bacterium]